MSGVGEYTKERFSAKFCFLIISSRHSFVPCLNSDTSDLARRGQGKSWQHFLLSNYEMFTVSSVFLCISSSFLFLLLPQAGNYPNLNQLLWAGKFFSFSDQKAHKTSVTASQDKKPQNQSLLEECKTEKQCSVIIRYTAFQNFTLASFTSRSVLLISCPPF